MKDVLSWTDLEIKAALLHLLQAGAFSKRTGLDKCLFGIAMKCKRGELASTQADFARYHISRYSSYLRGFSLPSATTQAQPAEGFEAYLHNKAKIRVISPPMSPVVSQLKKLHGFSFDKEKGYFLCDATRRNAHLLVNADFALDKRLQEWLSAPLEAIQRVKLDMLKCNPKDYQIEGISWLVAKNGRALLADDMGLGKSGQAVAWAKCSGMKKILVVCPASLKANWCKEIQKWTGETDFYQVFGKTVTDAVVKEIQAHKWVVINSDILSAWEQVIVNTPFDAFILDEVQQFKSMKAQRTKAMTKIAKKAPHLVALSGTPVENNPLELFPLFQMLDSGLFLSQTKFIKRFCVYDIDKYGNINVKGGKNLKDLHKLLTDTYMLRRNKKDVLHELPEKTRVVVPLSLSQADMRRYRKEADDFQAWLNSLPPHDKKRKAMAMMKINQLKQSIAEIKLPMIFDWIDTYLESGRKLVVFAHHKKIIEALSDRYKDICVVLDGSTPANKRQGVVEAFQTDDRVKLFIGNLKAAGMGITLTAASDTLTVELGWTSSVHDQAEDRTNRIGQKNAVTAYYLLAENTVEMWIAELIDKKRGEMKGIMDGEEVLEEELLMELLAKF